MLYIFSRILKIWLIIISCIKLLWWFLSPFPVFYKVFHQQRGNEVSLSTLKWTTAHKIKFSIKDFFSKCDQILMDSLKKFFMENFVFYAVNWNIRISSKLSLPPLCTIIFSQKLLMNLVDHNYITALETKEAHMVTWSQGRFRLNSQTIFSLPLGLGGDK